MIYNSDRMFGSYQLVLLWFMKSEPKAHQYIEISVNTATSNKLIFWSSIFLKQFWGFDFF